MEKNILLVDDDDKLRELISSYLEEKGFIISTCGDIDQVEELINYFIYDLIILDRMLPGGDGIDLVEKIFHNRLHEDDNRPRSLHQAIAEFEEYKEKNPGVHIAPLVEFEEYLKAI